MAISVCYIQSMVIYFQYRNIIYFNNPKNIVGRNNLYINAKQQDVLLHLLAFSSRWASTFLNLIKFYYILVFWPTRGSKGSKLNAQWRWCVPISCILDAAARIVWKAGYMWSPLSQCSPYNFHLKAGKAVFSPWWMIYDLVYEVRKRASIYGLWPHLAALPLFFLFSCFACIRQ